MYWYRSRLQAAAIEKERRMLGLPESLPTQGGEAFTGLVCPDCSGNLAIGVHGDHLSFTCRVGHAYGLSELVLAKDAGVEATLWRAVFAFEELEALLSDLRKHGLSEAFNADACRARADQTREQASRLRAIIEADRTLTERRPANGEIRSGPS
jgi:hypothetical protein